MPSDSVAKVGDTSITKDEFNRWFKNAASRQQQGGGSAVIPDPPSYTKCTAGLKKQLAAQKGAPKQSDAALKTQCKTQYDQLKSQVMRFLIQAEWVQQEAEDRDVEVSDAELKKSFNEQKKQAFPKGADYSKFLKDSGMTKEDILYRIKLGELQTKLTEKVTKGEVKVTDADIDAYYAKNKKQFARPQRRDLNVVLAKTKAKADQARAELESGKSFKEVSKKYSIDQASKAQGGKLPDLSKGGQGPPALVKAAFSANKGELTGPVKTQFGYYVFELTAVKAASQQSLAQAKDTIRKLLRSQGKQKALDSFLKGFRKKHQEETNCGEDYRVPECKNAPKSSTETPPAGAQPGAVPQGAAPQQAPQAPQGAAPQQAPQGAAPQQVPQAPQGSGATPQTPSAPQPGSP